MSRPHAKISIWLASGHKYWADRICWRVKIWARRLGPEAEERL